MILGLPLSARAANFGSSFGDATFVLVGKYGVADAMHGRHKRTGGCFPKAEQDEDESEVGGRIARVEGEGGRASGDRRSVDGCEEDMDLEIQGRRLRVGRARTQRRARVLPPE